MRGQSRIVAQRREPDGCNPLPRAALLRSTLFSACAQFPARQDRLQGPYFCLGMRNPRHLGDRSEADIRRTMARSGRVRTRASAEAPGKPGARRVAREKLLRRALFELVSRV